MKARNTNKIIPKTTIIKIIFVIVLLIADVILMPWIIQFPRFFIKNFATAPLEWSKFGILKSIKCIFTDHRYLKIFFIMQIPIATLILYVCWDAEKFKKKNRISDGVGGPEPSGNGQFGTARWQNKMEMDKTCSLWYAHEPIKKGGLIYGMEKSSNGTEKIWYTSDDTHSLIIGATRSGKSRKIIIPSICEIANSEESMILGDPKGELFISCYPYLKSNGYNIITLNLREPLKGNQWDIMDMVNKAVDANDIPKASKYAISIAHTICSQNPSGNTEPIWRQGEESTIEALILLVSLSADFKFQRNMTSVYYLLAEYGQPLEDDTVPLLEYIKKLPIRHPAKSAFATAGIAPYKMRASFFTTALGDLKLFSDPTISDMTSKQDHDIEKIGIDKTAVFLIIPDEDKSKNFLATLYIDQVYQTLVNLANKRGGRIPRRTEYIIDEFGNLPPIPDFDGKVTVAGGRGIRFTIALQDIAQLKKMYDKNASTISGNCNNWIYIKTNEPDTAELISKKTGSYTVETENLNSSIQNKGHSHSQGKALTGRRLLIADEVLRWDTNESLVLAGKFPARYPLPDLSLYDFNEQLGFVKPSGDVDLDKEENRKIIENRWNELEERELKETKIWLPDININKCSDDEEDENNDTDNNNSSVISDTNTSDESAADLTKFNNDNNNDDNKEDNFL